MIPEFIFCQRDREGRAVVNIPHVIVLHSPDGFDWGYEGSGPAELALNILAQFVDKQEAELLHQNFKREFIATLPYEGGAIPRQDIARWIAGESVNKEAGQRQSAPD